MSEGGIVLFALVGLLLSSCAWTVAVFQAGRAGPAGNGGQGRAGSAVWGWLPLWGFGFNRGDAADTTHRSFARAAIEVGAALYLGIVASRTGSVAELVPLAVFAFPLVVVLLVDWWTRIIYTNWIAVGTVLALGVAALDGLRSFLEALGGFAMGAAVFGAFYVLALLLYRDVRVVSLGAGDVLLAGMIGAMTGDILAVVGTLFYGILLAALGAGILLLSRRGAQKKALPSGAYLCAGAFVGLALQVW